MKKLFISLAFTVLVFSTATMASADWFGTVFLTDPTPVGDVGPITFDSYFPMIGDDWDYLMGAAWTDNQEIPYAYVAVAAWDETSDTFSFDIPGLNATIELSGLLGLPDFALDGVTGTISPNADYAGGLFSGLQIIFDPPAPGQDTAPVPEPATMLLLGTGLMGMAGIGRKKIFSGK